MLKFIQDKLQVHLKKRQNGQLDYQKIHRIKLAFTRQVPLVVPGIDCDYLRIGQTIQLFAPNVIDLTDFLSTGKSCPKEPITIGCGLNLVASIGPNEIEPPMCQVFDGCSAACARENWKSARSIFEIVSDNNCVEKGQKLVYGQEIMLKVIINFKYKKF